MLISTGICSLSAAKEYIQLAPETNLLLVDDNKTLGGVWAKENVYDGLRTNNHRGTLEFPDYPFPDSLGVAHGEHIPGHAVHEYLVQYAEKFNIANRIRYETKVLEASKLSRDKTSGGWKLVLSTSGRQYTITTDKLIVGTGLTSKPLKMQLRGQELYSAPFVHAVGIATEAPAIIADPAAERVTIYGGSKYAFDCVYKFAAAGKQIDWIIRKSGHGPSYIVNIMAKLPLLGEVWAERLVTTRFNAWMSPCFFGGAGDGSTWWRYLLHSTWLGRKVVAGFWKGMEQDMLSQAGYTNHPNLKPLLPDCNFFELGTQFGVLNYPTDLLEYVRNGQVTVHREDIDHLSHHAVHLANGTTLRSDAFLGSSGWEWRPTLNFTDTDIHAQLGIPSNSYSPSDEDFWNSLDEKADKEIFSRFPLLKECRYPPQHAENQKANLHAPGPANQTKFTPTRLYRGIAPPVLAAQGDRSLAFVGFTANISHTIKDELAGLWIYAYFNDLLTVDPASLSKDEVCYETALFQRWAWRRHPYGFGQRFTDYIWDAIPFNDVLLRELGMTGTRKKGWGLVRWWREAFEPYTVEEYRGVTAEWMRLRGVGR